VEVREPETKDFRFTDTAAGIAQFEKYMQSAEAALAVLDGHVPEETGMFTARRVLPLEQAEMSTANSDEILQTVYQIISLQDRLRELTSRTGGLSGLAETETRDGEGDTERETAALVSEITALGSQRRSIELFYDHLSLRKERYEVLAKTGLMEYAFIIEG
jgi:hypothetical protein